MTLSLRCQCGTLQGVVEPRHAYVAMTCYCKDCQAFARTLDRVDMLDAHDGTGIVAMGPAGVRFTQGLDQLACLSLSPKGLLRWYAACCNTPIANTPRGRALPYVGTVAGCIATPHERNAAFGSAPIMVNTDSARGDVELTPLRTFLGVLRIMRGVIAIRLRGGQRDNPFFEPGTDTPMRQPRVLTLEERVRANQT